MFETAPQRLSETLPREECSVATEAANVPHGARAHTATQGPRSYAVEVIADKPGKWMPNGVRLSTKHEARGYARDLAGRWVEVRQWRVHPSDDPVNYSFTDGRLTRLIP